jgi:hypothetical protein
MQGPELDHTEIDIGEPNMLRKTGALCVIVVVASQAVAQISVYGSPVDPSGNSVPQLTWTGSPNLGATVTVTRPNLGPSIVLIWESVCQYYYSYGYPPAAGGPGNVLILGTAPTSTVVTNGAASFLCLPVLLLVDLSFPYLVLQMPPTYWGSSGFGLHLSGWHTSISIGSDPVLIGVTFYVQAVTIDLAPGGCSACVYTLSQGLQGTIQP